MLQQSNFLLSAGLLIAGLLVGGILGYYLGFDRGWEGAVAESAPQQVVNPYAEVKTNPLEDVKTNPYSEVKVNPFD